MGTLGKVLLFVNLLAAIGVAVLAGQDYGKQQELAGTAVQLQVQLVGLPVEAQAGDEDAIDFPVPTPGGFTVETISKKRLDKIFEGYDGGGDMGGAKAVPTQMKEVDRVEEKVNAKLGAEAPDVQLAMLCGKYVADANGLPIPDPKFPGWLLRMAETYEEREHVRRLGAADNPDLVAAGLATAKDLLKAKFAAVRARPNPSAADEKIGQVKDAAEALKKADAQARQAAQRYAELLKANDPNLEAARQEMLTAVAALTTAYDQFQKVQADLGTVAPRDDGDRRRRVAHLLMHLDESAAWQKRVALVSGLRTYLDAVRAQADRLESMAGAALQQKVSDQARFSDEYELLKTLAVQQSLLLARQVATTADLRAQHAAALQADRNRYGHLTARQSELAAIKAEVAAALARQAEVEAALFDVQKRVGLALQANYEMEQQVEAAEKKGK